MGTVEVQRCTVQVRRRGGWSWGEDPRRLLHAAVRRLPALLGALLAERLGEQADGEIREPVRLRLRLPLRVLLDAAAGSQAAGGPEGPAGRPGGDPLAEEIRRALAQARLPEAAPVPPEPRLEEPAEAVAPERRWAHTVLRLLLAWREKADLLTMLRSFGEPAVSAWHEALLGEGPRPEPSGAKGSGAAQVDGRVGELLAALASGPDEAPVERQRRRLAAAAAVAAELGESPFSASVREAIDAALPSLPGLLRPPPGALGPSPGPDGQTEGAAALPRAQERIALDSVLPFLALGPLARIGWLEAAAATFGAAGAGRLLPALGHALALKSLPEPARGWHRDAAIGRTALAAAGRTGPLPPEVLAGLASQGAALLAPLDALVRHSLLDGHTPGAPLAVASDGSGGWLLVDPAGLFVLATGASDVELAEVAAEAGAPLQVTEGAATESRLRALDAAGVRFLIPVPPLRGEPWRRFPVRRGAPRAWGNGVPEAAARGLESLEELAARAREAWGALSERRPVQPGPASPAPLERSLALAAGLALATLAWTLWRRRGPTDALQGLERLGDLEGSATFTKEAVLVRMSLGRRHRDLREAGLLGDVPGVPWLGGRTLSFCGG